ncbi:MAG: OadG family protein [Desulfobacteraceae bacterium]|nr:OadG family protein [Desulfobacteraceae bacterium]
MIVQGLKLTILGMMVVFSFLILLLIIIHLSAKLLQPYTEKEAAPVISKRPLVPREIPPSEDNQKLISIITAAIEAHRVRLGRNKDP